MRLKHWVRPALLGGVWCAVCLLTLGRRSAAQTLPTFDFTQAAQTNQWQATHDVGRRAASPQGMVIEANGDDPYLNGPARDYPAGQPLWLRLRLKSEQSGTGQVFYYTAQKGTNEPDSVRFPVQGGKWAEIRVPLPPLGPGTYLRLDPPGLKGNRTVVASISFEPRLILQAPAWAKPFPPALQGDPLSVSSGTLVLRHARSQYGGFEVRVADQIMAIGHSRQVIGTLRNGKLHWLPLAEREQTDAILEGDALVVRTRATDEEGVRWSIVQRFTPGKQANSLDVLSEVTVNRTQQVVFLPMFLLLPGVGSFGESKNQAVFPGLEYLDRDEPSSSEADIIGPGAKRQVPDTAKITFPLMAIQANDRYLGLLWEPKPALCALFDSPDRTFRSGGHAMGVLCPGSDGSNRDEGSLLPYDALRLDANLPITLKATILGGAGSSVIPAVQQYVALRGLPALPNTLAAQDYFRQAATGWLDSGVREGNLYRHAYPGDFAPHPAADAALFMDWLAQRTRDSRLAARLRTASEEALAQVPAPERDFAAVGHVRVPAVSLLWGDPLASAARFAENGRGALRRFEPNGTILYRKSPNGLDYGRTHFAPDANGLAAPVVTNVLEAATRTGDAALLREGLRVLRALNRYRHSAPRGAQTWEVPLHTPDILASAYLVRAYTLGYEWTGERALLDEALYWAWTGVPFTYLTPPTEAPVGVYSTTPVFGATQWVAPNWMGLPVQWCGLVYADALYRLLRYDPTGPWKTLADGITLAGIQHNHPVRLDPKRQGLLPDSFSLRPQIRNDVAINPGTVQACAARLFGKPFESESPSLYEHRVFRLNGVAVHAPGVLANTNEKLGKLTFTVQSWANRPYTILLVGLKKAPTLRVNGKEAQATFQPETGRLTLRLEGAAQVEATL